MHLTFLPIVLLAIIGLGYYTSMAIGTLIVFVGVMICFEIARRASFSDLCSVSRVERKKSTNCILSTKPKTMASESCFH